MHNKPHSFVLTKSNRVMSKQSAPHLFEPDLVGDVLLAEVGHPLVRIRLH